MISIFSLWFIADPLESLRDRSKEIMGTRCKPSEQFLRRLKGNGDAARVTTPAKQRSRIQRFKDSDWWLWGEVIGFIGVVAGLFGFVFALIAFWIDLEDRQTQRIAQAWELVTRPAPGNSGKGPALEYLLRQGTPLVGIDLSVESNQSPSYLRKVHLPEADLRGGNLSEADLWDADLSWANLSLVNLSGADLRRANLSGADLYGTNFKGAVLNGANLSKATPWENDLSLSDLSWALLKGANLLGVDPFTTDLSEADLSNANLSGAYLTGADLSGANLINANFSGADLMYANFSEAIFWDPEFSDIDLADVNLSDYFRGPDFSRADLRRANFSEADLRQAKNLSQKMLDAACGNEITKLPKGLTIKACADE